MENAKRGSYIADQTVFLREKTAAHVVARKREISSRRVPWGDAKNCSQFSAKSALTGQKTHKAQVILKPNGHALVLRSLDIDYFAAKWPFRHPIDGLGDLWRSADPPLSKESAG